MTWFGRWERTRGWGPWKKFWASFCSGHQRYQEDCRLCNAGSWRNYWLWCLGSIVFALSPALWR